MDNAHPLSTSIVVRTLDLKKGRKEDDENILCSKVSYLNTIGVLLYLPQCTRLNIFFPYLKTFK